MTELSEVILTSLIAIADEGLNVRRFTTLDKSNKLQRKQKTKYIDWLMEGEVELQGKSKVPSNYMVLRDRESANNEAFDTSIDYLRKLLKCRICFRDLKE